jgi:hypothetical protein
VRQPQQLVQPHEDDGVHGQVLPKKASSRGSAPVTMNCVLACPTEEPDDGVGQAPDADDGTLRRNDATAERILGKPRAHPGEQAHGGARRQRDADDGNQAEIERRRPEHERAAQLPLGKHRRHDGERSDEDLHCG